MAREVGLRSRRCCGSGRRSACSRTASSLEAPRDPQSSTRAATSSRSPNRPSARSCSRREKSQIQALDRTAPILPMLPGVPQRATHDYKGAGPSSLSPRWTSPPASHRPAALAPPRDRVQAVPADARPRGPRRPRGPPGARQLLHAQDAGHPALADRPPTLRLHFTPTSSSWLNLVERWLAELRPRSCAAAHTDPAGAQRRHPRLDRDVEHQPAAVRRTRPPTKSSIHRPLLRTNQRIATLTVTIIPAPTVSFVASSMRMNEPVERLWA